MTDEQKLKPWYFSKTVIGGAVATIAGIAGLFGYSVSPEDTAAVTEGLTALGAVAGGLIAIIGRIRATQKIG